MRAACIQLRSGTDIAANIRVAEALIRKAASSGAQLIATPEMTHIVQRSAKRLFAALTDEQNDKGVAAFSALAKELGIYLLIGSLAIKTAENRAANRSFLFGPDGAVIASYDKIHLFDVTISESETWKESSVYDGGGQAISADVGDMRLGLSVCYDVRFPGLYRHYARAGADIIAVPAAFTKPTGEAHWEVLLRARAIETGAYILAPAQGGEHEDGRATWGHSMIIDPWGRVIAALDHDKPGFIMADIDTQNVIDARQKIPAWQTDTAFSA